MPAGPRALERHRGPDAQPPPNHATPAIAISSLMGLRWPRAMSRLGSSGTFGSLNLCAYGEYMLISARKRRIAVVSIAVLAACVMAIRAYRWVTPRPPQQAGHLSALEASSQSASGQRYSYRCTRVVDGDTIQVTELGPVRLIGIDTPEMNYDLGVPQPFAREAKTFCERLVDGKEVSLEFDVQKRDKYGRVLAYVFVGRTFVNAELVKVGLAKAYHIPPNGKHRTVFKRLERQAKDKRRGIWSRPR